MEGMRSPSRVPYLSIEFFETLPLVGNTPLYSDSVYPDRPKRRCLPAHDSHYTATLHLNEKLVFEWLRPFRSNAYSPILEAKDFN